MELSIKNFNIVAGGKQLFHIKQLQVESKEKIGFVASNGSGKTTLFKAILAGNEAIICRASLGHLPQQSDKMDASGGETIKQEMLELLHSEKGLLLLDEPSANLDSENQAWLSEALQQTDQTLVIISHDRHLLAQVVEKIWYLDQGELCEFVGNYGAFENFFQKEQEKRTRQYQQQQQQKEQLEKEIQIRRQKAARMTKKKKSVSASDWKVNSRLGSYDTQAKQMAKSAKTIEKRIERMDKISKPTKVPAIHLKTVGKLDLRPITLINISERTVQRQNRTLFEVENFKVTTGDHIGLVGANGCGKSTFLEYLNDPRKTDYYQYEHLSLGFFDQRLDHLRVDETILEAAKAQSLQNDQVIRDLLGGLGFRKGEVHKKIEGLSGGEKVRVTLAKVLLGDHQLLLLDEPSNFLDITALVDLENFLKDYPGAFILVSHDQVLVEHCTDQVWKIAAGKMSRPITVSEDEKQAQLQLLRFKKDRLIQDPNADLAAIQELVSQIKQLE